MIDESKDAVEKCEHCEANDRRYHIVADDRVDEIIDNDADGLVCEIHMYVYTVGGNTDTGKNVPLRNATRPQTAVITKMPIIP